MVASKRWGKPFTDERDWCGYNEQLVVRGEFFLDFEWVNSWVKELECMNADKVGARSEFPESLIRFQAVLYQWLDYRGLEGFTRKLAEHGHVPKADDYTTINRRVSKTKVGFTLPMIDCCVSTDGSGMKFENGGEYRARMYGKRRKYLKVVISADPVRKKMLACDVFVEGEGESEADVAVKHMQGLLNKGFTIPKFWGDGMFDDFDLFDFLQEHGIKPAVKTRINAVASEGRDLRNQEVEAKKRLGYKIWATQCDYGERWVGTEGMFSAVKRKFGENVRSKKIGNALNEVAGKFWTYDLLKTYAENQP
ncbi:IS5 family transposase [Candidatus Micrarchaeota archaeon]|nr:IS5 family transposase [Candidatus Micrarchaeota archaeon]